jgi:hypothetical protein
MSPNIEDFAKWIRESKEDVLTVEQVIMADRLIDTYKYIFEMGNRSGRTHVGSLVTEYFKTQYSDQFEIIKAQTKDF